MKIQFFRVVFLLFLSLLIIPPAASADSFGKIIKQVTADIYYINVGRSQGLFEGAVLDVIIPGEVIVDPSTGESFSMDPQKIGKVKVVKVLGDSISQVSVIETRPGYRVEVLHELEYNPAKQKVLDVKRIKTIALLPLKSSVNTAYMNINVGSVVSNVIGNYISKYSNDIQIVEKDEMTMNAIMKQYELELAGIITGEKGRELGKILGADAFITGSITGFPSNMATLMSSKTFVAFNAKMVDLRTAKVIYSNSTEGASKTVSREEAAAQAQMAEQMLGQMGIPMMGTFASGAIQSSAASKRKTPTELTTLAVRESAMNWAVALLFKMEGDPVQAFKYRNLALTDLSGNNIASATKNIGTAIQSNQNDPFSLKIQGEILLANRKYAQAEAAFQKARDASERTVWVMDPKTGELVKSKKGEYLKRSLTTYEKLVIGMGYSEALLMNNNVEQAEQTIIPILNTLSSSAVKDKSAFSDQGKYDKKRIQQSQVKAATLLASAEMYEGEYASALIALKGIKQPGSFTYLKMSECHYMMGDFKDSIATGQKALKGRPPATDAYQFIVRSLTKQQRPDHKNALKFAGQWIKETNGTKGVDLFAEVSYEHAQIQIQDNQKSAAKQTLRKAIKYNPSDFLRQELQALLDSI